MIRDHDFILVLDRLCLVEVVRFEEILHSSDKKYYSCGTTKIRSVGRPLF